MKMKEFLSPSISFQRLVDLLVWFVSCVAMVFGFINIAYLNNGFVFWSTIAYIIGLFSILPLFRSDGVLRRYGHTRLASIIELLLVISLVINGFGALGWYRTTEHYDDFVHFVTPAMITWGIALWYTAHVEFYKQEKVLPRRVWAVVIVGLILCVLWEPTEYFTDKLLGTETYGQAGQQFDTRYDIVMDALGVIVGWIVFLYTRVPILRWIQKVKK